MQLSDVRVSDVKVAVDREDYEGDGTLSNVVRLNITISGSDDSGEIRNFVNPIFVKEFKSPIDAAFYAKELSTKLCVS